MKTLLKIVGALIAGVVVLVVAAVIIVPLVLDPEDVKRELSTRVEQATGRELSIPGEVELSVFPWLGVRLGQVSLGNAAGFEAPVFASTETVEVRVKLMPLLSRRLEMDTVTVHGLTLNLERDAGGRGNWEDLAAAGDAPAGDAAPAPAGDAGPVLAGFAIGGVDLRDAAVSYADRRSGQRLAVRDLALKTGALAPGEPVAVELGFGVESSNPALSGRVTATASVAADAAAQTARADGLEVEADLEGPSLPGGRLAAGLAAELAVDAASGTASVRDLVVTALDLSATGALEVSGLGGEPSYRGELAVPQFSPRELLAALGAQAPRTADPEALASASLATRIAGGADALTLDPLTVKLDQSTLTGNARASGFAAPALRFALALDAIDVDRYLPPGEAAAPANPGAGAAGAAGLPLETLRALDVEGSLEAARVKVAKLALSELRAKLTAKDGVIRLSPLAATLYEGAYAGNIVLDARGERPRLSLDETLTGVQAGPLLADLRGSEAPITGTANVSAQLSATGAEPEAIKSTLDGELAFQFLDGAVNGTNIGKMIRDARARLQGESPPQGDEPAKTDFAEITGTATVSDGLISNQDLTAKSPLLRVTGKGTASLPQETVDYRARVTLVATSKGQGGKELEELAGVPIPLRVSGSFAAPSYGLDLEGLASALAQSKAKELVDEQKAKVEEKVREQAAEKLGDSVGKVLGGDDKGKGKGLLDNLLRQ